MVSLDSHWCLRCSSTYHSMKAQEVHYYLKAHEARYDLRAKEVHKYASLHLPRHTLKKLTEDLSAGPRASNLWWPNSKLPSGLLIGAVLRLAVELYCESTSTSVTDLFHALAMKSSTASFPSRRSNSGRRPRAKPCVLFVVTSLACIPEGRDASTKAKQRIGAIFSRKANK